MYMLRAINSTEINKLWRFYGSSATLARGTKSLLSLNIYCAFWAASFLASASARKRSSIATDRFFKAIAKKFQA